MSNPFPSGHSDRYGAVKMHRPVLVELVLYWRKQLLMSRRKTFQALKYDFQSND